MVAIGAAWAAWPLIATGFDRTLLEAAHFHPLFFGRFGIPAFSEAQRYTYGGAYLYPVLQLRAVSVIPLVMIVVCLVAALGPAFMASRMRPADSLRYV